MTSTAYLLISHGSRDPRHQAAINRLAQLVRERLNASLPNPWAVNSLAAVMAEDNSLFPIQHTEERARQRPDKQRPDKQGVMGTVMTAEPLAKSGISAVRYRAPQTNRCIVGSAVLEFGLLPLHKQIVEFGRRLSSAGVKRLQLVPLFLLQGRHVMDDIPEEVELARRELGECIEIILGDHMGGYEAMPSLIAKRLSSTPAKGRLLVAHGSRRAKGNRPVDKLAKSLGTSVAYWTNESDIEHQTIQLMQQGCSTLTVFPYFLFAGGITDAVAHLMEELAERFPRTKFRLMPPLGATADMADLVVSTLGH